MTQNKSMKTESSKGSVSHFLEKYFLHFNAATVVDAAKAY